jgi:hypothetical protein
LIGETAFDKVVGDVWSDGDDGCNGGLAKKKTFGRDVSVGPLTEERRTEQSLTLLEAILVFVQRASDRMKHGMSKRFQMSGMACWYHGQSSLLEQDRTPVATTDSVCARPGVNRRSAFDHYEVSRGREWEEKERTEEKKVKVPFGIP